MVDIGGNEEGGEEEAQREQTLDCEEGCKEVVEGHGIREIGGGDLLWHGLIVIFDLTSLLTPRSINPSLPREGEEKGRRGRLTTYPSL